jgi:hypothetical protein
MAFTVNFRDPTTGHPRYNFDQSVRKGGRGVDVELLQVLLNMLYFDLAKASAALGFVPPTERLIEDGIVGPDTIKLATHCYHQLEKNGAPLANTDEHPEARGLDPMRQPGERSRILVVRYFIDLLNDNVSFFDAQTGLGRYALLPFDRQIPRGLRNALKTVKAKADKYRFEK